MSGSDAFFSFCNYIEDNVTGLSIQLESWKDKTLPVIVMQNGIESFPDTWVSSQLCQGWLMVEKVASEPLEVTASRWLKKVGNLTMDAGSLVKYDYTTTPKSDIGTFIPKLTSVSPERSEEPNVSKRLISWTLKSNAKNVNVI